jgi:hypothetical protein
MKTFVCTLLSVVVAGSMLVGHAAEPKKIVLVAGGSSHGRGSHEHRAGCLLLAKCLSNIPNLQTVVVSNGWPTDQSVFNGASAIVLYSDGDTGHPFIQGDRLQVLGKLMKQGVGLGCLHFAVEVPKDRGGPEFLDWIGGYFEAYWSVNPFWTAEFKSFPSHPVSRGVQPFKMRDEWYYHMRFRENMEGVTPSGQGGRKQPAWRQPSCFGPQRPGRTSPLGHGTSRGRARLWIYRRP